VKDIKFEVTQVLLIEIVIHFKFFFFYK